MAHYVSLVSILLLLITGLKAQDVQFSQFYSAPLYLNPALTGATQYTRVGSNYRSQWPALEANFITTAAWVDHFIDDKNSGIGFLIQTDKEGLAGLRSTSFTGLYAYQMPITKEFRVRVGASAGYVLRDINFSNLTFGDQYDANGFISVPTAEVFDTGAQKSYFDMSLGGLLYSQNAWLGVANSHTTMPNQSLIGQESRLPMKWSVHGGYKFFLKSGLIDHGMYAEEQERSLAPTFQYKKQGEFNQLDLGLYFTIEPIVIGTWYRGFPFKNVGEFINNESIVILLGYSKKNKDNILNIGYSYDITISKLGSSSGGAHEFSISYAWFTGDPRKPPKHIMQIPCPDF
ncbi:MAG: type IX secretion system membrane protein PorP/SprF [Bacteroidota bacterium]